MYLTTFDEALPNFGLLPHLQSSANKIIITFVLPITHTHTHTCLLISLHRMVITKLISFGQTPSDWITYRW